ncbi:hypothetical protein [Sphingomonas soli]|uniref:hypothetical protein n=1 Tax=Sphingomonas soli TaxID=266127 RepID=UPI001FE241A8|nr:hypothetical protein [Sphingomonas soli]
MLLLGSAFVFSGTLFSAGARQAAPTPDRWWSPGEQREWPELLSYPNDTSVVSILRTSKPIDVGTHPFFQPLGENGRACVTCHQPADGMSLSAATAQRQWAATGGKDPLFAMTDGANCANLKPEDPRSHSLLLERGLIRIPLPWPSKSIKGEPEIKIEVVRDPTGCNLDKTYGMNSASPTISVFRRPRPVANLRYILTVPNLFNIKTGYPVTLDAASGKRTSMNLMSDARLLTLKSQAEDAASVHLGATRKMTQAQLGQIEEFTSGLYMAATENRRVGRLDAAGATAGVQSILEGKPLLGDFIERRVFPYFEAWKSPEGTKQEKAFRASVARGEEIFMMRPFYIRDVTHLNTIIGMGNPIKRTCATCHNMQHVGIDGAPGWMDLGTNTLPWAERTDDLPLFKVTCSPKAAPHPYLGRVIHTTDPGRALITGKCVDVGAITLQQMRGLAARAPYFANGSARDLRAVVDFYDRRFEMKLTEQEKEDLTNFMGAL